MDGNDILMDGETANWEKKSNNEIISIFFASISLFRMTFNQVDSCIRYMVGSRSMTNLFWRVRPSFMSVICRWFGSMKNI